MRQADCIFCKIIAGEIPSNTIYEDDTFKVILDASPASKGHALILAGHMTEVLGCDGFNILQNNHEVAGQTVFHFHMHLIPRYQNAKNNDILMWSHENFSDEEMAQIRDSLSRN